MARQCVTTRTPSEGHSVPDASLPFMATGALPPGHLPSKRENLIWRQEAILCWMPLPNQFGETASKTTILANPTMMAIGASCSSGSVVNPVLPLMAPVLASPPDYPGRPVAHHTGCQSPIFRWVPLLCQFWKAEKQTVSQSNSCVLAIWAPAAMDSVVDPALPFMSSGLTFPPDHPFRPVTHHGRRQCPVLRRMPLLHQIWKTASKAVLRTNPAISAIGTPFSLGPVVDYALPFMAHA